MAYNSVQSSGGCLDPHMLRSVLLHVRDQGPAAERRRDGDRGKSGCADGARQICVKGLAGTHLLYDPYRVNYPLKRTNPQKGLGVDPKFVRISWEEALDTIVKKLKACQAKDSRGAYFQATTTQASEIRYAVTAFNKAFGTPNYWVSGGGLHCGNGAHFMNGIMHVAWSIIPDFAHCNLPLNFGCSKGHGAGHTAIQNAQQAADARARGARTITFDPMQSPQASKAHEWVPIRVGTDGALALGFVNVFLNELGKWDDEYLKYKTNAPYLIRPSDGRYMRDKATNKPQVWDLVDKCPKVHNDPSVTRVQYEDQAHDVALLGTYEVEGVKCRPAFELLKEHVKKYSPEYVEKITWIPAATITAAGQGNRRVRRTWRHGYHRDRAGSKENSQTADRGALLPRLPRPHKLRMDLPVDRYDQPHAGRRRYLRRRDGSGRGGYRWIQADRQTVSDPVPG